MKSAVDRVFEKRLAFLLNCGQPQLLQGGRKGVEKESLRVNAAAAIAQTPHPKAFGRALTNDIITTDYSEALLELVTPTFLTTWELLQYLLDLHQFVYRHLQDEWLWATSMPCNVKSDAEIPVAQYGSSNVAKMKVAYRMGLGVRYGRLMQAISGVHFNYSFPEAFWPVYGAALQAKNTGSQFVSSSYFNLLRNYRRYGWIVLYLFGVSPVVCQTGEVNELYATSLRMSDIGYRNRNQAGLRVSVNSLEEYVADLKRAINTPHPPYQQLGVQVDGEYRQLNANILQIENEYYSYIRPKRIARSGEMPTKALERAGVEYVEVRALDVSAFDPVGVNQNKLRFLEAFMALCLFKDSPLISTEEESMFDHNHLQVARYGRQPELLLQNAGRSISPQIWGRALLDEMQGICEILDHGDQNKGYQTALANQRAKLDDVSLTPAARLIKEMTDTGESFFELAWRMSRTHKQYFLDLYKPNEERQVEFARLANESIEKQQAIERADSMTFEHYLQRYFAQ
jgi:glutamate--cysteine ligase